MAVVDAPGIDRAPMSKPLQARLILTGTAGVILGVLALWLFAWVIARKPGGLWTARVEHAGPTAPILAFQHQDAHRLGDGSARALEDRALESALDDAMARGGSGALVLYLSAPGATLGGRAVFLPADQLRFTAESGGDSAALSAEALAERLAAAQGRRLLLILDAGQLGTDRELGVFGNGFLAGLAARLREKGARNVVVLSSCAPGQVSHVSEADRQSVFAEFVARGLAGEAAAWDPSGRLTVQGLARYVREQVESWVETHHQSVQTPVLLGDTTANFSLRPTRLGAVPQPSPGEEITKALDLLEAAWKARDGAAAWHPERHTPVLWARYLDALLRAERLLRAGRIDEMNEGLAQSARLIETMHARRDGWPRARAWSLAEAERTARLLDGPALAAAEKPIAAARAAIVAATDRLTGRIRPRPEAPPPAEAPSKDAAPPAQASGSQGTEKPEESHQPPSLTGLVDAGREDIPSFLEAQPLVWAIRYARRPGASSFRGARGELLRDILAMQAAAVQAATRDDRLGRRFDALRRIDADRRRPALDGLFARDDAEMDAARRAVGEALRAYQEWERATQDAAAALDLRDRLQAEWPFYGEWLARRGQARGPEFQALCEQSVALARMLGEDQPAADELARTVTALGRAWDALEAEARTAAEQARTSGARWRDLDDLLALPFLPADLRRALLERLLSVEVAGSLHGGPAGPVPGAGDSATTATADGPAADPRFWPRAVGQAEVELTLLRMGGAEGPDLDTLRLALESARNARDEAAATAEALAQFSARVPAARAELLGRSRGSSTQSAADRAEDGQAGAALVAADRAARSLPATWTRSFTAETAPDALLDRWNRYRRLLGIADGLLDDFAAEHAGLVLAEARSLGNTGDLRAALERAGALAGARLAVATDPAGAMTLADQPAEVKVVARPEGLLPEGRGAVLMGFDPGQPITVRRAETAPGGPAAESGSVHIAGAEPDAVRYLIDRTEYTPEAAAIELAPEVFYRGHSFPASHPLRVALDPAREAVTITLQDPNPRGFRDQYLDHPGRGFLHYNAGLGYRLGLRNNTEAPLTVWVSAMLDGQTSPPRSLTIAPGKTDTSLGGHLQAVDLPPPKPDAPAPPPGPDEAPLGRPRTLTVEVREKNETGRPLANVRRYVFEQLPVERYAAATTHFSPNDGRVYVVVHHLAADRVNGPVSFLVTVAGMSQRVQVQKGQSYTTWFSILPPWPEKVRYSVQVGDKPNAFVGEVSTGIPTAPPDPKAAAAPASGSP